jgi:hypothetical protein
MDNEKNTLAYIQAKVKAPKKKSNNFGKYKYRNVEDIFEAVKPVLEETGAELSISDEVRFVDGRFYLVSTATLKVGETTYSSQGWARETESRTGMDPAQLTGACSSYARKYALCALFLIDGSDDFDDMDNREEDKETSSTAKPAPSAEKRSESQLETDTRNFLNTMKTLSIKNHQEYMSAMGSLGYEKASDIPVEKRREIYIAVKNAVEGAIK